MTHDQGRGDAYNYSEISKLIFSKTTRENANHSNLVVFITHVYIT